MIAKKNKNKTTVIGPGVVLFTLLGFLGCSDNLEIGKNGKYVKEEFSCAVAHADLTELTKNKKIETDLDRLKMIESQLSATNFSIKINCGA